MSTAELSKKIFYSLVFLYFAFSSAELLHAVVGIYKPKIGHIIALILLGWVVLEKRAWKIERQMVYAFALILASLVISALFGAAPKRSFGYIGVYLFNFIVYFLLPIQVMQMIDLSRFFRIYWSAFVVIGLYATAQVVLSLFGIYDVFAMQRVAGVVRGQAWMYEPSYYALYMIPYVMYHNGMALLFQARRLKLFGQNMLMMMSTSTGLIVSYPVFFVVSLMMSSVKFKQLKKALMIFFISLVVVTLLFYEIAVNSIFKFFYFGFLTHDSFGARWQGIVASVEVFLRHPLIGVGLGGVSTDRFHALSIYDVKMETLSEFEAYDPTNCFTEIVASLGVVGLAAFIYLGVVVYRAFRRATTDPSVDESSKKMATALFISLIAMVIALQMNQGLFRPYVWIHAAVVYGFLRFLPKRPVLAFLT